jgi:hypothetical protein
MLVSITRSGNIIILKIARFLYIWFSVCSQKIFKEYQRFILLYLVSQIWAKYESFWVFN